MEQKRLEEEKRKRERELEEKRKREEEERRSAEQQRIERQRIEDRKSGSESRETVVSGNKFNISTSLKKTSRMSSREDLRETKTVTSSSTSTEFKSSTSSSTVHTTEVGGHLRGLNQALEALAGKQNQQDKRAQLLTSSNKQVRLFTKA